MTLIKKIIRIKYFLGPLEARVIEERTLWRKGIQFIQALKRGACGERQRRQRKTGAVWH